MTPKEKELTARAEELAEEVRQLRAHMAPELAFPADWLLTPQQGKLLGMLYARYPRVASPNLLIDLLYPGACNLSDPYQLVRAVVSKLRKKVGLVIIHSRGIGWTLSDRDHRKIKTALERMQ